MVSTLGKIAMGIMVAKGIGGLMGKSSSSEKSGTGSTGGIGDLIGGLMGNKSATGSNSGGNITDMLGGLLGGGAASGGLGGLLNSLTGGDKQSEASGKESATKDTLGSLLSKAFGADDTPPQPSEEEKAKIILKAMISAAKSDGTLDDHEREQITKFVGDVTQEELAFIKSELDAPMDLEGLIKSVPADMAQEVYMMSLLAINLDHPEEAKYLDKLAQGLNISHETANAIHEKLNAPKLYNS